MHYRRRGAFQLNKGPLMQDSRLSNQINTIEDRLLEGDLAGAMGQSCDTLGSMLHDEETINKIIEVRGRDDRAETYQVATQDWDQFLRRFVTVQEEFLRGKGYRQDDIRGMLDYARLLRYALMDPDPDAEDFQSLLSRLTQLACDLKDELSEYGVTSPESLNDLEPQHRENMLKRGFRVVSGIRVAAWAYENARRLLANDEPPDDGEVPVDPGGEDQSIVHHAIDLASNALDWVSIFG